MMVPAASADGLREGEVDVDRFVIVVEEDQVVRDGNDVADAGIVVEDLEGFDACGGGDAGAGARTGAAAQVGDSKPEFGDQDCRSPGCANWAFLRAFLCWSRYRR